MTMMNGSWNRANRNVTASDSQACPSPSSVCQLRSPTNASGSCWSSAMLLNVNASDAIIGASVNRKNPISHGAMNT